MITRRQRKIASTSAVFNNALLFETITGHLDIKDFIKLASCSRLMWQNFSIKQGDKLIQNRFSELLSLVANSTIKYGVEFVMSEQASDDKWFAVRSRNWSDFNKQWLVHRKVDLLKFDWSGQNLLDSAKRLTFKQAAKFLSQYQPRIKYAVHSFSWDRRHHSITDLRYPIYRSVNICDCAFCNTQTNKDKI